MTICVVLVEPQGPGNLGAIARAMMNFGMRELRLVAPQCDPLAREARMAALDAIPLLECAKTFESLRDALADRQWSIGTTRREGKYRVNPLPPRAACARLAGEHASQRAALVFGREDCGLHTAELDLCQSLLTIPTHAEFPSMNLAHAVTVCLYELSVARNEQPAAPSGDRELASSAAIESMLQHMRQTLTRIEYLDPQNPDHVLRAFRGIFSRAGLDERDVRILQGLWSRIDYIDARPQR